MYVTIYLVFIGQCVKVTATLEVDHCPGYVTLKMTLHMLDYNLPIVHPGAISIPRKETRTQ